MKKLLLGNEAVARGLYEAGCGFVSSYPGTPSTEITEEAAKYDVIYAESCVELQGSDAVVHLSIFAMRLPSIIERGIKVVLPNELLSRKVPITDAIIAMLAISCVLVSNLKNASLSVMKLV